MWIKKLTLHNFRIHRSFKVQFDSGIQLIYGENGAGKTNLIEALNLLTQTSSFKTRYLVEAINHNQNSFELKAQYQTEDVDNDIQMTYLDKRKILTQNKSKINQSEWIGTIPFTTYLPSDMLELLTAPVNRRKFINLFICQKEPLYTKHLMYYTKVLRQRNAHLKSECICNTTLDALDKQMLPSALYLQEKRAEYIQTLSKKLNEIYQKISEHREEVCLEYDRSNIDAGVLINEQRSQDKLYKTSQIGPHRDDVRIILDNRLAQQTGSEGQKTSLILSLKLAEQSLLNSILAVDDFGAHLDKRRSNTLLEYLQSLKTQVFITSTKNLDMKANRHEILARSLQH